MHVDAGLNAGDVLPVDVDAGLHAGDDLHAGDVLPVHADAGLHAGNDLHAGDVDAELESLHGEDAASNDDDDGKHIKHFLYMVH